MSGRKHERCQNPQCNAGDPVCLDSVLPPLRRDAKWCSRACREQGARIAAGDSDPRVRPERFWAGIAARRTRESRTTRRMKDRCAAARRARRQAA